MEHATPWWIDAVVYQIYPRSFADSDGDGMGDLVGIESKLDYLSELGIDVIWLSPVYPSPQDDNGYDISDYYGIDPAFGTLEQFDRLLERIHARGMKLIMDLVVNHTSDEHPWFVESRSSRDNPKRDWYWWRDEPNNWGSIFSGSAWEFDEQTQQYYLHLFSRKQPDLNWENPQVRAEVHRLMNWWLDRGVDGFRMDVINLISKVPGLPDGQIPTGGLHGDGGPFYVNGPRLHEFLHEMYENVFAGRTGKFLTVGETPGMPVEQARLVTDPRREELDMVFHFEHVSLDHGANKWDVRPLNLLDYKAVVSKWQYGLADVGWNSLYLSNHDQPRIVSRFGDDDRNWYRSATMWAVINHLQRGTPYVYQGEELGMTNFPFSEVEQFADVESRNYYAEAVGVQGQDPRPVLMALAAASRDNARTPMQWDDSEGAGFTTGQPWLPVNPNHKWLNARAQVEDPDSVFTFYRRLIELRHTEPVVCLGDFEMLLPGDPQILAFTRTYGVTRLLVVANVGDRSVDVPLELDGEVLLANHPEPVGRRLEPWEARIYRLRLG